MTNLAVFASGTGSNFLAILDAIEQGTLTAKCVLLVSDRPNSLVVKRAKERNIAVFAFRPNDYTSKQEFESAICEELAERNVTWIALAGYMRLIGPTLLNQYPRRIVNIHPSLLPAFKGLDAVGQAMAANVPVTGVTIHYVDDGMDTGDIIAQQSLDIQHLTTRDQIEHHIHAIEHELYPATLHRLFQEEL